MDQKLKVLLAALLPAGPLALSAALAPPAHAAVQPTTQENRDVAARLAGVQKAVAEIELQSSEATPAAPSAPMVQEAWWANGWHHGWGWRNGGWGWRNGGWGNWHHWVNGWHNGGWGNWHPWGNWHHWGNY